MRTAIPIGAAVVVGFIVVIVAIPFFRPTTSGHPGSLPGLTYLQNDSAGVVTIQPRCCLEAIRRDYFCPRLLFDAHKSLRSVV